MYEAGVRKRTEFACKGMLSNVVPLSDRAERMALCCFSMSFENRAEYICMLSN